MKALLLLAMATAAAAHVGSPDVYLEGAAGPYPLLVTVRPPTVIPGVAEVDIRSLGDGVERISITPTPMVGPGAKFAPTADPTRRDAVDRRSFTGSLWMMSSGSWQVRVRAEGQQGAGELRVPVPSASVSTLPMSPALSAVLFALMVMLALGLIAIAGAAVREATHLETAGHAGIRQGRVAMLTAAIVIALSLWGGQRWWTAEANSYDAYRYKPLKLHPTVDHGQLTLKLEHTGWFQSTAFDDIVPDHGKIMHLFVVRLPALDRVWHLHPTNTEPGEFTHALPAMPAGRYQLYADIVHRTGFPETLVAEIDLPAVTGSAPAEDDSTNAPLTNGDRIVFETANEPLKAKRPANLRFRLEDAHGNPPQDQQLYLGMPAHAIVLRKDRGVFTHLHPSGTVPMAALELADPHALHRMHTAQVPNVVAFPYGFPSPGDYRLFVQMKRAGQVETAAFDLAVK